MVRTISVPIYKFEELSNTAKNRAKQDYAALFGYSWSDEMFASLRALAAHFGGKLADYSVDWFKCSYSSAKFSMPDAEDFDEPAAYEEWLNGKLNHLGPFNPDTGKGLGSCVLTGFCGDEDAIDGLRIAYQAGERDLEALMEAAFDSWLKAGQADCEAFYENDEFAEHCDANNYEFYEDGRFYRG